jgi:hypothetical protein
MENERGKKRSNAIISEDAARSSEKSSGSPHEHWQAFRLLSELHNLSTLAYRERRMRPIQSPSTRDHHS